MHIVLDCALCRLCVASFFGFAALLLFALSASGRHDVLLRSGKVMGLGAFVPLRGPSCSIITRTRTIADDWSQLVGFAGFDVSSAVKRPLSG